MRKTVVDGSNTSGFQRTSLIATDGVLETSEGPVGVDVVCLEEDSARKLDTVDLGHGQQVIYNLDRLGLPLSKLRHRPTSAPRPREDHRHGAGACPSPHTTCSPRLG